MTGDDRPDEQIPPEQLCYRLAELKHRNADLEKFNQALTGERDVLNQKLADCSRMLNASTTGLISLDKSGLIEGVNARAVHMLGADSAYLLKKPIGLFIAPEDQAVFYINRSRILAGSQKQPFEIELKKKNGGMWSARIDAQPVETPDQHLPGMLLAVEDVTAYRQALEALQLKEYVAHLLQSILNDLSAWPVTEIDDIITGALEKMALAANGDRVYVCLLHHRKTLLSVTHEWCGDEIESPAPDLTGVPAESFSGILNQMQRHRTVAVADLDTLAAADRAAHEGFHPSGVQSILLAPLVYGGSLLGL
ncbi:MAG: PAS domain S-box protein, partial [Desulfosarcina sp.]